MASVNGSLVRWSQWVLAPSAGPPPAGPAVHVFRSTDVDETRHAIAQVFIEHELQVLGPGFDAALAEWDLGSVTIAYVREGAEVSIRTGRYGSWYGLDVPVKGSEITRCGRREGECATGSVFVQPATEEIVMHRSADWEEVALRIDREALEGELSRLLHREIDAPVVFDPSMSLSTRAGSSWAATLGFVLDEICRGTGSLDHPLVRSRVEQLLIDQLLMAQQHTFSGELETGHRPARPPTVHRAVEIIQARAADPLTIPIVAALADVSARSLQQGFRDYLGTTPLEYLREVRLARAREDLLASRGEAGASVTQVAYRWGFGHLARFAGYYKQRYGELPSQTLRRSSRSAAAVHMYPPSA